MKDGAQKEWAVYTFRKSFKDPKFGEINKEGAYEFRVKSQDGKSWSSEFDMNALKDMPSAGIAEFMKVLEEAKATWEHVEKLGKPKP